MLKIDQTKLNKLWNSLVDKGPVVVVMGVIIFLLYGWVDQGRQEDRTERVLLRQDVDSMRVQQEHYQRYVQEEVFKELQQSRLAIERNSYILEQISRQMYQQPP